MSRFAVRAPPVDPVFQSLPVGSLDDHLPPGGQPVDQGADCSRLDAPVGLHPCREFHPALVQSAISVPLWTQNPAASFSPMVAAQLAVPVLRQYALLRLDLPANLVPSRSPQGRLCPDLLDPSVGHALEGLLLHLHRRHLWRGSPPAPFNAITQSATNTPNLCGQ